LMLLLFMVACLSSSVLSFAAAIRAFSVSSVHLI
jgi:hypothetical protein